MKLAACVEGGVYYDPSVSILHCNDDIRHFEFCLCHLSQSQEINN